MSDADDLRRDPVRRTHPRSLAAGVAALCLAAVAGCGGVVAVLWVGRDRTAVVAVFGPSESREGQTWTLRQLREYLETRGLNFRLRPHRAGALFIDAAEPPGPGDRAIAAAADEDRYDGRCLMVERLGSVEEARAAAEARGDGSASWGRFVFRGSDELLGRVLHTLR